MRGVLIIFLILTVVTSLDAEEKKVKKGVIMIQPLLESRARDASEKTTIDERVVKYKSTFYYNRLLLRVATQLFEKIEIFGDIGGSNLSVPEFDDFSSRIKLAYGGGINLKFFESPSHMHSYAFLGARYLHSEPFSDKINVLIMDETTAVDSKIRWAEWESMIGAGTRIESLDLSGGLRFSLLEASETITGSDFFKKLKLNEEENAGIFIDLLVFIDPLERTAFNIGITAGDVNSIFGGIKLWF